MSDLESKPENSAAPAGEGSAETVSTGAVSTGAVSTGAGPAEAPLRWIGAMEQPTTRAVYELSAPLIAAHGLVFVGVELAREGARTILWLFIDRPQGGVTIHDCARLSPEVSAALDVQDPLPNTAYELRVSSPGLDRPLMSDADFNRYAGRQVQIMLSTPLAGRRKFTGKIEGADEQVRILSDDGPHSLPLSQIQKARLRYDDTHLVRRSPKR